jgi:hypothetical protein
LSFSPGVYSLDVDVDLMLLPRTYTLTVELCRSTGYDVDFVERVVTFAVNNAAETGNDTYPWPTIQGYVRAASQWSASRRVADDMVPVSAPVAEPIAR